MRRQFRSANPLHRRAIQRLRFAGKHPEPEKWKGVEWSESQGSPRLDRALVWVACELRELIEGGRLVEIAAEAGKIGPAEVVGEDEDHVGLRLRGGAAGRGKTD